MRRTGQYWINGQMSLWKEVRLRKRNMCPHVDSWPKTVSIECLSLESDRCLCYQVVTTSRLTRVMPWYLFLLSSKSVLNVKWLCVRSIQCGCRLARVHIQWANSPMMHSLMCFNHFSHMKSKFNNKLIFKSSLPFIPFINLLGILPGIICAIVCPILLSMAELWRYPFTVPTMKHCTYFSTNSLYFWWIHATGQFTNILIT